MLYAETCQQSPRDTQWASTWWTWPVSRPSHCPFLRTVCPHPLLYTPCSHHQNPLLLEGPQSRLHARSQDPHPPCWWSTSWGRWSCFLRGSSRACDRCSTRARRCLTRARAKWVWEAVQVRSVESLSPCCWGPWWSADRAVRRSSSSCRAVAGRLWRSCASRGRTGTSCALHSQRSCSRSCRRSGHSTSTEWFTDVKHFTDFGSISSFLSN